MRASSILLAVGGFCLSSVLSIAHAAIYYSNPTPDNGGYQSSGSNPTPAPAPHQSTYHHHSKHVSISVSLPPANAPAYYAAPAYPPRYKGVQWVDMWQGKPLPTHAVIGGNENHPSYPLYVCRGAYQGGVHPGKLISNHCNIGWGGAEIRLSHYQVLVSRTPLAWASADHGFIPPNAINAGYENGAPLYACQAQYDGGMHPGKVIGSECHFGWGGREISTPFYNVLVR